MAKEKNKYGDLKSMEEAIELLNAKDTELETSKQLIEELTADNQALSDKVKTLEKKATDAGALPGFSFDGKNYSFTARSFHIKLNEKDAELEKMDAQKLANALESKNKEEKQAAERVIKHLIENKIGVIKEEKAK